MTELCPSEEKESIKDIIDGFNGGSKRLEILNQYILKKTPSWKYMQVTGETSYLRDIFPYLRVYDF
jgi:hypothetical protein